MTDIYQPPEAKIVDTGKRFRWSHALVAGTCSVGLYIAMAIVVLLYYSSVYTNYSELIQFDDLSKPVIYSSLFFITAFLAVLPFQKMGKLRAAIIGPLASIALFLLASTSEFLLLY